MVNPPQKPTVNNIISDEFNSEFLIDQPSAKPIKKHPNTFDIKVG